MSRFVLLVGLGLLVFVALGPALEAALPCEQPCPGGDGDGDCSRDLCCSCCVHVRLDGPRPSGPLLTEPQVHGVPILAAGWVPSPEPHEILHVPKLLAL
jgi:hypothetical protein